MCTTMNFRNNVIYSQKRTDDMTLNTFELTQLRQNTSATPTSLTSCQATEVLHR